MGLGKRKSFQDVESWRLGPAPGRREVIAVALVVMVVTSLVVVYTDSVDEYIGDTCGYEPPVVISLDVNRTEAWRFEDSTMWNAWYDCTGIQGGRTMPWDGLTFRLYTDGQTTWWGSFNIAPEEIPQNPLPMGYYMDQAGDPLELDVGDRICLANLNRSHQGTKFDISITNHFQPDMRVLTECEVPYSIDLEFVNASLPRKGSMVWDVTLRVRSVSPEWELVPWSFIRTRHFHDSLHSKDWYEFHDVRPLSSLGDHRLLYITGYYNDSGPVVGFVDAGDAIVITGNVSRFIGTSSAALFTGNTTVAVLTVPSLPDHTVRYRFSEPNLTSRVVSDNKTLWDCEFVIEDIEPEQGYLEWGNPRVEFPSTGPGLDVPWWANSDKGTYPESAQVFIRETDPVDGRVDVGDAIVIKSMTEAFEGRMLVMRGPGTTIRLTMPAHFEP